MAVNKILILAYLLVLNLNFKLSASVLSLYSKNEKYGTLPYMDRKWTLRKLRLDIILICVLVLLVRLNFYF